MSEESSKIEIDIPDSTKVGQLLFEYNQLTEQLMHWDNLSLKKDNFYFSVQGVFLIATGSVLINQKDLSTPVITLIAIIALFNLLICRVWHKSNRRNREYFYARMDRAREIEKEVSIHMKIVKTQDEKLSTKGAFRYVIRVPIYTAALWVSLFLILIWSQIFQ